VRLSISWGSRDCAFCSPNKFPVYDYDAAGLVSETESRRRGAIGRLDLPERIDVKNVDPKNKKR